MNPVVKARELAPFAGFRICHRPTRGRGRLHYSRSPWLLYRKPDGVYGAYEPWVYHTSFATADQLLRYLQRKVERR